MKMLITGGAGYLGSIMVGRFLADGHQVTVLDNLMQRQAALFHYCTDPNFDFVRGDARDEETLKPLLQGVDVIIPLAGIVGMPACKQDPQTTISTNYESVVLLNRLRSKEQWVLYPCTNSGYGTKSGDVHCTEDSPLEPISLYGRTKVDGEKVLLDDVNTLTFRLATVFGPSPRMRMDLLVNDFTYRAVTDGFLVLYEEHFKRNYVHTYDVADAFAYAIENFEAMKGEAYNLGLDDANLSKRELAEKIKEYVPNLYIHAAEVGTDPDKRNYIVSNEKLRRAGFEARRSLDVGIQELIKAYRMIPQSPFKNI